MLNAGLLACSIMNRYFSSEPPRWRIILFGTFITSVIQLICVVWMSPSPSDVAKGLETFQAPPRKQDSEEGTVHQFIFQDDNGIHDLLRSLWGENTDGLVLERAISKLQGNSPDMVTPVSSQAGKHTSSDPRSLKDASSRESLELRISEPSIGRSASDRMLRMGSQQISNQSKTPISIWEFLTLPRYRRSLIILCVSHASLQYVKSTFEGLCTFFLSFCKRFVHSSAN
jgi:hypothetical protein